MKVTYWIECFSYNIDRPIATIDVADDYMESVFEDIAADYHDEHDGWEDTWPITFSMYKDDDKSIVYTYKVDRYTVPEFEARRVSIKA
jgi:hypothetical protein